MTVWTPRDIDGIAALMTAEATDMQKREGERDTEFVKRIVCTYMNAAAEVSRGGEEGANG